MKRLGSVLVGLALVFAACGGGGGDGASGDGGSGASDLPPNYVLAKGLKFRPDKLTVKVGDEVTFDFDDGSTAHNAVADDKSFDTGVHTEKSVQVKMDKPGTHKYVCTLHPGMEGTITVQP